MQRRICQIIEVQHTREIMYQKAQAHQDKIKTIFDRRTNKDQFFVGDLVLRWDARKEEKGKHDKFDFLWFGTFKISQVLDNNTCILQNIEDQELSKSPVNGHFLKHFFH